MKPYLTEKSVRLASTITPVYTLAVALHTSAPEIRQYLKRAYDVDMISVRFLSIMGENTRRKGIKGFRSGVRKALVVLKKGQRLPEFEAATKSVAEAEKADKADKGSKK
jgi:large subunit ribosomal protein L23